MQRKAPVVDRSQFVLLGQRDKVVWRRSDILTGAFGMTHHRKRSLFISFVADGFTETPPIKR